jgi:hypothetical protein
MPEENQSKAVSDTTMPCSGSGSGRRDSMVSTKRENENTCNPKKRTAVEVVEHLKSMAMVKKTRKMKEENAKEKISRQKCRQPENQNNSKHSNAISFARDRKNNLIESIYA